MMERINLTATPEPVFAGLTGSSVNFGDPVDARIRMLKNKLIHFSSRIEEQGTSVKHSTASDCANAGALRGKLGWLAARFNQSRAFPLFKAENGGLAREGLFSRYLAALSVDSMDQIEKAIAEANALRESLPEAIRDYFTPAADFAAYFAKVGECLKAMARLPEDAWREVAHGQEPSLFARLGHRASRRACLDLLHECITLGNKLAHEIEESEKRLSLVLSLAQALGNAPAAEEKKAPPTGALNSFIRATPI